MTDNIIEKDRDPLILGGHTFTSRFILGSGKYSLDLIHAAVEQADAQIITLPCAGQMKEGLLTYWTIYRSMSPFCPIPPGPGMRMRPCALHALPGLQAAGTL